MIYDDFCNWFNSTKLDVGICGALGGRMGLRLVPLFAGMAEPTHDETYLELIASVMSALAVVRARSKYPRNVLLDLLRDAATWLEVSSSAYDKPKAEAMSAAGDAAVKRAEADKGAPLTAKERVAANSSATRQAYDKLDPAYRTAYSAAICMQLSVGALTSHTVSVRDLPRFAKLAFSSACLCPNGPLCGEQFEHAFDEFMAAIAEDVAAVKLGADVHDLSDLPLWQNGEPESAASNWRKLKAGLQSAAGWSVWSSWYEERLRGPGYSSELLFTRKLKVAWGMGPETWDAFLSQSVITLPDLPVAPSEEQQIAASARTALLIRRSDFPVRRDHCISSFIGGLPTLPPWLEWPRAEVDFDGVKSSVALTFLAQINLADLPQLVEEMPLPKRGMLFFFVSSAVEGEGNPPVRVLFDPKGTPSPSQCEPPADLMMLGGPGCYSNAWLAAENGLHARVQFKYPISFHTFKDYAFDNHEIAHALKIKSLCEILGTGEQRNPELWQSKSPDKIAADEGWPFNLSIAMHVLYSVREAVTGVLTSRLHRARLSEQASDELQALLTVTERLRQRFANYTPFWTPSDATKLEFRRWWRAVVRKFSELKIANSLSGDISNAIEHNVNLVAEHNLDDIQHIPQIYTETVRKRNSWTNPNEFKYGINLPIHQLMGYGHCVQKTPISRRDEVLLLQLSGDQALFPWLENCGCVLQLWVDNADLHNCDFSKVEATLDCD
jgi:uncharacterized protein YwqG